MKNIAGIMKVSIGLIAVCGLAVFAAAGQRHELTGTKWQLTHIDGKVVATNKAFLEFDPDHTRFSGNAGCNRMFGDVKFAGRLVDFGSIGTTRMACVDSDSNRIERSFTSNLENVKRFRVNNSALELLNGGRVLLRFTAAKQEAPRLESRKWVVEEIGGKTLRVKGIAPFVVLDQSKASAGGDTGCNVFSGSYAASGNTIRIFDTVSTMRACVEDERMTTERQFMGALQNANRFEIRGNRLLLYRGNKLLMKLNGAAK